MNNTKAVPAIIEHPTTETRERVIHTYFDDVSFVRGMGDSGRRIGTIDRACPACDGKELLLYWKVSPVERDIIALFCLRPGCAHYHNDEFSWAITQRQTEKPEIDNTDTK